MIIANETQFGKLNGGDGRALENSYVYLLSSQLNLRDEDGETLAGNDTVISLCPPAQLVEKLVSGDISKKKFKKSYIKHLESSENRFLIYTIIRSLNEKNYMPIFVCSDDEWETGYLKIFAGYLKKEFGLEPVKIKKYLEEVKKIWKQSKKAKGKRSKAFRKSLKSAIKDNVQVSFEGIKKLEKMEKEFAIDRIAILINQSDDAMDEISKKAVLNSITAYEGFNKKSAKLVKRSIKELGLSKKRDRWGKKEAFRLAMHIYQEIHGTDEDEESEAGSKE